MTKTDKMELFLDRALYDHLYLEINLVCVYSYLSLSFELYHHLN